MSGLVVSAMVEQVKEIVEAAEENPKAKTIAAIAGLVIIEVVALFNGIDGVMFGSVVAAIAGLGGYNLRKAISGG